MFKVQLDTVDFEMDAFQGTLECLNIKAKVVKQHGPGGGLPLVEYRGTKENLILLIDDWFDDGTDDNPLYDEIQQIS